MSHKEREDIVLKSLSAKFAKVLQLAVAHLVTVNKHIHELMVFWGASENGSWADNTALVAREDPTGCRSFNAAEDADSVIKLRKMLQYMKISWKPTKKKMNNEQFPKLGGRKSIFHATFPILKYCPLIKSL